MHLQTNVVTITPEPREELRLEAVPKAIHKAGFRPAEMELRARGSYVVEGESVAFRIRGWSGMIAVAPKGPVPEGEVLLRAKVDYSGERVVLDPLPER